MNARLMAFEQMGQTMLSRMAAMEKQMTAPQAAPASITPNPFGMGGYLNQLSNIPNAPAMTAGYPVVAKSP